MILFLLFIVIEGGFSAREMYEVGGVDSGREMQSESASKTLRVSQLSDYFNFTKSIYFES